MDLMEPSSSSYMPVRKAIVPPDTPGITSAAPMPMPLRVIIAYEENFLIIVLVYCCQIFDNVLCKFCFGSVLVLTADNHVVL